MKEAVVFIDMCGVPLKSDALVYSLVVEDEKRGFSQKEIEQALLTFFQDFKTTGSEKVRYILVSTPVESSGLSFSELMRTIRELHQGIILLPYEAEAFILLPSVGSNPTEKAQCFGFFETLERSSPEEQPSLVWLIDTDRLSRSLFSHVLLPYLSTGVYRAFNGEAMLKDHKGECLYSSIGLSGIVFSAEKWRQHLSLILVRDILNTPPLSPLPVTMETARMALAQVFPFLKARFDGIANEVMEPTSLLQTDVLLEGVYRDEEWGADKLFAGLDLIVQQKAGSRWETIFPKAENFVNHVREEFINVIDHASHGPYSAWGFIGLLIFFSGPYIDFFQSLEKWPEDMKKASIQSYLFGWQEGSPSPVLNLLFSEIIAELCECYEDRHLPFPEPQTWRGLAEELERLLALDAIKKILGKDHEFITELKERVQGVVKDGKSPYTHPFTGSDLNATMDLLESRARRLIREAIEKIQPIKKNLRELEERIDSLGWLKLVPFYWHLFFKKWELNGKYKQEKIKVREACIRLVEIRKRLFPCYLAVFFADKLHALLQPLEREIRDFVSLLEKTIKTLDKEIKDRQFDTPPLAVEAVENGQETKNLYHHEFSPEDIPLFFEPFIKGFKSRENTEPKLSHFFESFGKRQVFINGLHDYAFAKFSWIAGWDVSKVISYLKKGKKAAIALEHNTNPFLQTKADDPGKIRKGFFIGLRDEDRNPLDEKVFASPSPLHFSTGNPEIITGLTLYHGFFASAVEGWNHWKACSEAENKKRAG